MIRRITLADKPAPEGFKIFGIWILTTVFAGISLDWITEKHDESNIYLEGIKGASESTKGKVKQGKSL